MHGMGAGSTRFDLPVPPRDFPGRQTRSTGAPKAVLPAISHLHTLFGVVALMLIFCGCGAQAYSLVGTWHIAEIPNDTWTFEKGGRFSVIADNAPYDTGSYELTTSPIRQDSAAGTTQELRIHMSTQNTPPYAITWLDPYRFCLTADHVALTLYR
jgi:hypothetical protein